MSQTRIINITGGYGYLYSPLLVQCPKCGNIRARVVENISIGKIKIWCDDCEKYIKATDEILKYVAQLKNEANPNAIDKSFGLHS